MSSSCSYCVIQVFTRVKAGKEEVLNEMDCPLLQCTDTLVVVPSIDVKNAVSVIHECGSTCDIIHGGRMMRERELVLLDTELIKHDYKHLTFHCLNSYCINLYS